jgi:signal-transduction protein with cAMP-binding, CBS, and nucleotidyltransferase domain
MDSPKSDYIRTLRRPPLFTDLSDVELAQIAEGVSRLYFEEGTLIFGEGDLCRELLIVEEGTVKIVITPSTKLVTLFNWRHIGRGVHKNSSSPPWASPA